jgi:U32 family peptidase
LFLIWLCNHIILGLMDKKIDRLSSPMILAPAGNKAAFLAALAARADAVYCGLKQFSARMEAKNFNSGELTALIQLAHEKGAKVFVTLNSILKADELKQVGAMLEFLQRTAKPDGIIIQDLALVPLAKQTGFSGEIHLSTLANVSFSNALRVIRQTLGVDRVVLPRELNVDELKTLARACPDGLKLEVFVHGALCYAVSGRCYWSSYLGGKSGLRGRCVQPCRRRYRQNDQSGRYFSCQDLSVDVLTKVLLGIPQVQTWKIEGRKKGPHYVYYTVQGYRLLRDHGHDPQLKKNALAFLGQALGRTGTHYFFLPQRPQHPVNLAGQTGSGLLVGNIRGTRAKSYLMAREALFPGDVLRLGYEDEAGHAIQRIGRFVPKNGRLYLDAAVQKGIAKGAPVFLTDRHEEALEAMISELGNALKPEDRSWHHPSGFNLQLPEGTISKTAATNLSVYRKLPRSIPPGKIGVWWTAGDIKSHAEKIRPSLWLWLPPVVWPENETEMKTSVEFAVKKGVRHFVLNAPWQIAFFSRPSQLNLWAGPFCNLANPLAIDAVAAMGFAGAIVSPELAAEDYLQLPRNSPIALGIVVAGNWPLCISRSLTQELTPNKVFSSPKREEAWVTKYGPDYWVYPSWKIDLHGKNKLLQQAGYTLLVHMVEPLPKAVALKKRPGLWNWELGLE